MNVVLPSALPAARRVPSLRGPGVSWVPAVLREQATWRTVGRFVVLGPLIGVLPWAWLLLTIPVAYALGMPAAAVAGLLFACWYHADGRTPTWPWRAAVGALSGLGAAALMALCLGSLSRTDYAFVFAVVAIHGVPASTVLALLHKPAAPMA